MSDKIESIRAFMMAIATILFSAALFDAIYGFKNLIQPGISLVYNAVGTQIEPNMVTLVVFDWRGFDTLGESLILVTAVLVVLLIFGKGKILDNKLNSVNNDLAVQSSADELNIEEEE
jgi:energy-converting hydrogenase B subunit H